MNNATAFTLFAIVAAIFLADWAYFDWDLHIFLGKQLVRVTTWLAFWRDI